MRRLALFFLALGTGLLAAGSAVAQNQVTGVAIDVHATFHSVGVMVTISGDDNMNAGADLEIDLGSGFVPAHRLSRPNDDVATDRFVGSAFFLAPGTAFEVRATLNDPDGVVNGQLTGSGTTRALEIPESTGNTWHVSPDGHDDAAGTLADPFATVGRGVQEAAPGDVVLVHEGVYHEEVDVLSGGTAAAPITIMGAPDETAVMDGADPDLKEPTAWTSQGGGLYSASLAAETYYVSVDGVRLWRYETLAELQSLAEGTDGGFHYDTGGSMVYVRLPGDDPPDGHEIQVSTLGRALWIAGAPNVVVRGLKIRCYGSEEYSEGIMVRDGSHNVWIVESVFENNMPGVWIKGDVDDLTVMANEFSDVGLAEFPWYAVKAQGGMESGAIAVDGEYDGQGIVFYDNYVHDSFDGLNICGGQEMGQPNNADVIGNTIRHLGDDGIEADGFCANVRVLLNRFEDSLVGISAAPATGGPVYAIRNLIADLNNVSPDTDWMTRAFKFNVSSSFSTGDVFAYHNTAVTYEADQAAFGVTDESVWQNLVLLNNIWVGTELAFSYNNSGDDPLDQDFDLFHATGSGLIYFQGTHFTTVEAYNTATGLCQSCLADEPLFLDPEAGLYGLMGNSPAVDQGLVIPGVNEDYTGDGPDIGAYEIGGDGPDTDVDSDSDADTDADADSDTDGTNNPIVGGETPDTGGCKCHHTGGRSGSERSVSLLRLVLDFVPSCEAEHTSL
jgi:hypothetical protein